MLQLRSAPMIQFKVPLIQVRHEDEKYDRKISLVFINGKITGLQKIMKPSCISFASGCEGILG